MKLDNMELASRTGEMMIDCDKVDCLLNDLIKVFDCANPDNPDEKTMFEIRCDFASIRMKLWMISDYMAAVSTATQEMHDESLEGILKPAKDGSSDGKPKPTNDKPASESN